MGLLNPGGPIAQSKRNDCSISPVELISLSGVRSGEADCEGVCTNHNIVFLTGQEVCAAHVVLDSACCGAVEDEGYFISLWRLTHFVEGTDCFLSATPELFEASARAFGRFQYMLQGYPAETLPQAEPQVEVEEKDNRWMLFPAVMIAYTAE